MTGRLNAKAFEFVPGQAFKVPQQERPPQSDLQPIERPERTEPPRPAPSISINIGGSRPSQPAAEPPPPAVPKPKQPPPPHSNPAKSTASAPASAPASHSSSPAPPAKSYNFSTEKAKTDTDAVVHEVHKTADSETLGDLYGKQHLNVVFIGHVDAGKSTLGGNLLYITGMVDKRTMEKYEKEAKDLGRESWYLSWALDSTPQERNKGKTVEVGRAYFETPARKYTILDAPGHKTFVPSMISGAAQADVALLVISARKGEFETGFERGGQTREHVMLVKTAGVSKVVIVINKMDDMTVEWSKARYDEIHDKLVPFLKSAGFNPKTDLSFIPVSAYAGLNLKDRVTQQPCPWWNGPSLLELLDTLPMVDRKVNAPVMIPISEKYKDMGTIAVGKIESGRLYKGDALLLMPNRAHVEVSSIYNELEDELQAAQCGDNVRIRLRGVEDEDLNPGFVLTSPVNPVKAVKQFEAQLAILDHKNIICAGYGAVMHIHTLAEEVTLAALISYFDKKTGRRSKKPPQFAKKGQKIVALVEATAPVCVERFSDYPQLGRFTLRDEGKTIAIGKITKLIESGDDVSETLASNTALGVVPGAT